MKKAAEQQHIVDLMTARESAKKNKAVSSDGCPGEFWKYISCVSMVVIFRFFPMRFLVHGKRMGNAWEAHGKRIGNA